MVFPNRSGRSRLAPAGVVPDRKGSDRMTRFPEERQWDGHES